jgi:predicted HAD superfamily Cof-like phosphohydrolase
MSTNFQKVRDFNISFGIGRSKTPDDKLFKLRWDLIQEESNELFDAIQTYNCIEIIDALSDILYVVYGAADSFESDFDEAINLESNHTQIENKLNFGFKINTEKMKHVLNEPSQRIMLNKMVEDYNHLLRELNDAFTSKFVPRIIKHLTVIHNYLYEFANLFQFNLDYTFDMVHQSNMSKLAETEELAKETVKWYLENEKRYDSPAYRLSPVKINKEPRWVIYNLNSGKALKSIHYKAVDFTILFEN